jgi:hypothetical protein
MDEREKVCIGIGIGGIIGIRSEGKGSGGRENKEENKDEFGDQG